jgi:hypothetical protein
MKWFAALAVAAALQDQAPWTGSIAPSDLGAFPKGTSKGKVHFGVIEDAKAWTSLWERLGGKAPEVDFKKNVVLFVVHAKWPGGVAVGDPVVKDGVVTYEIALDGARPKPPEKKDEEPPKQKTPESICLCHYDYEMRAQARADVKTIRLVCDDKELGEIALKR